MIEEVIELGDSFDQNLHLKLNSEFRIGEEEESPEIDIDHLLDNVKKFENENNAAILYFTERHHLKFEYPVETILENVDDLNFICGYLKFVLVKNFDIKISEKRKWDIVFNHSLNTKVVLKNITFLLREVYMSHRPSDKSSFLYRFSQVILRKLLLNFEENQLDHQKYIQIILPFTKVTFQMFNCSCKSKERNIVMPIFASLINRVGCSEFRRRFEQSDYLGKILRESIFSMSGFVTYNDFILVHEKLNFHFTFVEFKEALEHSNIEIIGVFLKNNFPFKINNPQEVSNIFRLALKSNLKQRIFDNLDENIRKASGIDNEHKKISKHTLNMALSKNRIDVVKIFFRSSYLDPECINILRNFLENNVFVGNFNEHFEYFKSRGIFDE